MVTNYLTTYKAARYIYIGIYVAILLTPLRQLWLTMGKKRFKESKFSKLEAFKWVNCVLNERKIEKIDRKMTILSPQNSILEWCQKPR